MPDLIKLLILGFFFFFCFFCFFGLDSLEFFFLVLVFFWFFGLCFFRVFVGFFGAFGLAVMRLCPIYFVNVPFWAVLGVFEWGFSAYFQGSILAYILP